jgi:hypothetical protein
MRLIKVSAPEGKGARVVQTAFSTGIETVSLRQAEQHSAEGERKIVDVVDIETSTPKGKRFVDALLTADFYNQEEYSLSLRAPLSIISSQSVRE